MIDLEFSVTGGYWPSSGDFPPQEIAANTLKAGQNVHVKAGNKVEVANGTLEISTQNVGSRIFEFNDSRAEIAGNVANRLPFASLIRLPGGIILFLSELTGQQVYINEAAVAGLTTASSAGILRIAIPSGGGYNVYDAGFDPINLPSGNVTTPAGGTKGMSGDTGVALCPWRTVDNAIGPPSNVVVSNLTLNDTVLIQLPAMATGQDGWIYAGTAPDATETPLRVIRYVRTQIRGTFTATAGSPNLTAGVGTFFMRDLRAGDVITIDGGSYTVASTTSQTAAVLTGNFAGVTGAGKTATITSANAEWFGSAGEQGDMGVLVNLDVARPPQAAGVASFFNRIFLFGTDPKAGDVVGPGFRLMLPDNPEHIGLIGGKSESGTDILNALSSGDERSQTAYLMTRGALEIIQFTDQPDDPYRTRILRRPGFLGPKAGIVYENVFYGFSGQPLRTVINQDVDVSFGQAVDNLIRYWVNPVVMGVDPQRGEVLFAHYDGATFSSTTVLPYIPRLGIWGPPIVVDGQIDDFAVVGDVCYATVFRLGVRRVHQWEGGSGLSGAYIGFQYQSGNGVFELESYRFAGRAETLTFYVAANEAIATETSNPVGTGSETMVDSWVTHSEKYPNVRPGVGVSFRLDFSNLGGNFEKLFATIRPKTARR